MGQRASASILLVEPEPALCQVLSEAFSDEGLSVTLCSNLADVARAVAAGRGEVAVVDAPPGSDVERLAEMDRRYLAAVAQRVPTIVHSAHLWARELTAEELGVLAIVLKPCDLEQLCRLVRTAARQGRPLHGAGASE
jgi:DNA-binding NtrC family response regulator